MGTGWVYRWRTMLMLELLMEATEEDVVERATAVRNWSESAARWAVWLWEVDVGVEFCEWRVHDIAML